MFERGRGIRKPGECLESQGTCGQDRDFGQPAAGKTGLKIRSWSLEIDSRLDRKSLERRLLCAFSW